VFRVESEVEQSVVMRVGDKRYVASPTAITAARAPSRDKLLSPERQAAIATVASFYGNNNFVYEHWILRRTGTTG
jgi:hypothetical protein